MKTFHFKGYDKEFQIFDAFGSRYPVRLDLTLPAIFSWSSSVFLAVVVLFLWLTDPADYVGHLPWWAALFMWFTGLCLMICIYVAVLCLWAMTPYAGRFPVPMLMAGFPAFLAAMYYHHTLAWNFSGGTWVFAIWPNQMILLLAQQAIESMYLRYGVAKAFREARAQRDAENAPEGSNPTPITQDSSGTINLPQMKPIALADILSVRAQEHYLEFTLKSGDSPVVRARMGDFIACVSPHDGIQPHRSWWVSYDAAEALVTENGKKVLRLTNGDSVPVSRARTQDVQDWMTAKAASLDDT